ncbi:hypothetical protein ACRFB9_28150 [Klebsiella pneumoniae]
MMYIYIEGRGRYRWEVKSEVYVGRWGWILGRGGFGKGFEVGIGKLVLCRKYRKLRGVLKRKRGVKREFEKRKKGGECKEVVKYWE